MSGIKRGLATIAVCKRTESTESQTISSSLLLDDDLIRLNVALGFDIRDIIVDQDPAQLLSTSNCLAVDRNVGLMSGPIRGTCLIASE